MVSAIAPHTRHYRFAGLTVEVAWDAPLLGAAVHRIAAYFGFDYNDEPASPPEVQVSFRSKAPSPAWPGAGQATRMHNDIEVCCYDARVYLRAGTSVVELDPAAGTGRGVLDPSLWKTTSVLRLELVNLVIHSLLVLLRRHRLFPLHAAALAQDDAGLLLVADSDSGKSTQAMGLVRRGWAYLSDDSVVLQPDDNGVAVRPLRQAFGLDEDAAQTFPEIAGHWQPFLTDERKRRVRLDALYPGQARTCCHPYLILFPRIVPRPLSRLVPVSPAEAMQHLLRQSPLLVLDARTTATHLDVLKQLVQQAPTLRLEAGRDLLHAPERMADLVGPYVAVPA